MPTVEELEALVNQLQTQINNIQAVPSTSNGNNGNGNGAVTTTSTSFTTTTVGGLAETKQLNGSNYQDWKFCMKNFLIDAGLWNCVENNGLPVDPDRDQRTLAKIGLSVKPAVSCEIRKCTTAKEAWDKLKSVYEDSGIVRIVDLYQKIFRTNFSDFPDVKSYVYHLIEIGEQLDNAGHSLDSKILGAIILAGLPTAYKPLILGFQGSKQDTKVEIVKKLLTSENISKVCSEKASGEQDQAHACQANSSKFKGKGPRCYNCNKYGHISKKCPDKKKSSGFDGKKHGSSAHLAANFASCGDGDWYVDSGASCHLTGHKESMNDVIPIENREIKLADGNKMKCTAVGNVAIPVGMENDLELDNVVHAPDAKLNLLAVSGLTRKGNSVLFDPSGVRVFESVIEVPDDGLIARGIEVNGLFKIESQPTNLCFAITEDKQMLWHRRLGHANRASMQLLLRNATGIDFSGKTAGSSPCEACCLGKQHRLPFPKSVGVKTTEVLQLIHSDLSGKMEVKSIGGANYFLTFIDDFSRKCFIYFLKSKDEAPEIFMEFKALVENQTGKKIKCIRSDRGGEYVNSRLSEIVKGSGIKQELTVGYAPEQNGVAERFNRSIVEKARSMLADANLSKEFWGEACATSVYIMNRLPTKLFRNATPEDRWSGKKQDLKHLRVFGCKAMVHIPKEKRRKWDMKAKPAIFVGYSDNSKGYRLIDPETDVGFCQKIRVGGFLKVGKL